MTRQTKAEPSSSSLDQKTFYPKLRFSKINTAASAGALREAVATVDNDVGTGGVGSGVGGKVQESTLELVGLTLTAHGDLALPDVLGLLGDEVGDLGGHVAGRDGVGAGELDPLNGEGAAQVDDTGLGSVVCSLELGNVDNVAGHGGRGDEAAVAVVLELVAVEVGALLPLPPPDLTGGTGAEEGTVKIGGDDLVVVGDLTVDGRTLGPWDARVGNEDVQTAVELLDNIVDLLLDIGLVGDVDLVGLACITC